MPKRRLPVGAETQKGGGVHFRVWAPCCSTVALVIENPDSKAKSGAMEVDLAPEGDGYFASEFTGCGPGILYRYRLNGGESFPDPASRYQPAGPHGPSCILDPEFPWTDREWRGLEKEGQVLYEMHVGTFTREGTWKAAERQLPALSELGVTAVEVMPVAEFPGRFGWGYDGVNLFAPTHLYGTPDDFRRFVDTAHSKGIGVILDVVYNHVGPEGNYLHRFSPDYFTDRYTTEWGTSINFDGENCGPVRDFYLANAGYWIEEFHLDGLRFDATQSIFDSSPRHILSQLTERAREAAGERTLLLIAESEPQRVELIRPHEMGGCGMDSLWNDDFHHSAHVALTGYNEAYYSEYLGSPQELISAVKWGFLYQGQRYFWQGKRRGTSTLDTSAASFVNFLENHDQIANSAWGRRIHQLTSPGSFRAMSALLLLAPGTPMLFQGQEFAASSPFLYFADLSPEIARQVRKGRVDFLRQFTNITSPDVLESLDNPSAMATFELSKLDLRERERNAATYALYRDLLRLRREDLVFSKVDSRVEGAVLGAEGFLLRYFADGDQRLLLINLGRDLRLRPAPEPLLASPENSGWDILWSSESPSYGGSGTPELETDFCWRVPGHAAVVLKPSYHGEPL